MRNFLFTIGLGLALGCTAQNILPNSGFEEPVRSVGNRWQQPVGQYEHYELNSDFAANGNYYSGLCMYSSRPNEYFFVPLLEHLEEGAEYQISMQVRVWEQKCIAFHELDSIGILFDSIRHDVSTPFYAFDVPDLKLALHVEDPHLWYEVKGTYTADGSEKYLMIGNFFERPQREVDPLLVKVDMDPGKKKGPRRKKEKDMEAFRQAVNREMNSAQPRMDTGAYYHTRFYFDDICLAQVEDDRSYSCHSRSAPAPPKTGDVIVAKHVNFEVDEATLLAGSFIELDAWVELLALHPEIRIQIQGHTDDTGNAIRNQQLSMARARSVLEYLVEKGVARERLTFDGFGATKPIADNASKEGRAANRRVEFVVLDH